MILGLGRLFALAAIVVVIGASYPPSLALAQDAVKRVAVHVDESDPKRINMALNNVANIYKYYEDQGQAVEIRVVAYGPGLHMFREDTSPVKDRLAAMSMQHESLTFAACANTLNGMTKKEGKEPKLVTEASLVPSGVVELIELQGQGWAYIRP